MALNTLSVALLGVSDATFRVIGRLSKTCRSCWWSWWTCGLVQPVQREKDWVLSLDTADVVMVASKASRIVSDRSVCRKLLLVGRLSA